jgi:hypothetical protein
VEDLARQHHVADHLTYRRVEDLARQHHVAEHDEAVKALDDGLAALARAATAP